MHLCGTDLVFKVNPNNLMGEKKLHSANFCKVRLCPMCAWRRSLKIFHQVSLIMNTLCTNEDYNFLFLTLTVKNVRALELSKAIDDLFYGFKRLSATKEYKKAIKGSFRALEVTHNTNRWSKSFDTYHPHFHCILVVGKRYFKDKEYISQKQWVELWKRCMDLDYSPMVDIRKINNPQKSVPEVSKYTIKDTDYIIDYDTKLTDKTVDTLDSALQNRRLFAFAGVMREAQKQLNLDEEVDDDLIHTDGEELREDLAYVLARYRWHIGLQDYAFIEFLDEV